MVDHKIKVGIVGISFGMEFIPIYLRHPDVYGVAVADTNEDLVKLAKEKFGIADRDCYHNFEELLKDETIDAIHITTPPATHADFSIRALRAGKHCGCTIPMGMNLKELEDVIRARKESKKQYMFMETTVFGREYFYVKDLINRGEFGKIQYMTCAHYQDMEGWPSYWEGFPPLMHPTHAIGPCFMLLNDYPKEVYAKGSGRIRDELIGQYNSPFAFESALVTMKNSDVAIEMERFLYGVARSYSECFRIYGSQMSFEWQQLASEDPVIYKRTGGIQQEIADIDGDPHRYNRGSEITEDRIKVPDYASRLPESIGSFTTETVYNDENTHLSFKQGGGHGGSHPHMIHEFVRAMIENRQTVPDDIAGAYWTGTGICAHKSAMKGGVTVKIPEFEKLV